MSISYDTMSAYMERETNRLVEEDKAVQKKIADDAITKVMGAQNQINTNIGNAVETAYRQNAQTAKGLQSETSQIGNQALTERLVRGLNTDNAQINTTLDNLKSGIRANEEQNLADIDREYGLPQAERRLEIRLAQQEQNKALKKVQETAKAQEGFLEKLNELSRQANYDYDFDADIFKLKQQGYTSSDWQIQYLQEAKRLQTLAKKTATKNNKSQNNNDNNIIAPPKGNGGVEPTTEVTPNLPAYKQGIIERAVPASEKIEKEKSEEISDFDKLPTVLQKAIQREVGEYEKGNMTIEELNDALENLGARVDEDGYIRGTFIL